MKYKICDLFGVRKYASSERLSHISIFRKQNLRFAPCTLTVTRIVITTPRRKCDLRHVQMANACWPESRSPSRFCCYDDYYKHRAIINIKHTYVSLLEHRIDYEHWSLCQAPRTWPYHLCVTIRHTTSYINLMVAHIQQLTASLPTVRSKQLAANSRQPSPSTNKPVVNPQR